MFSLLVRRCWCTCLMVDTVTARRTVRRGGTNMTITKYDHTNSHCHTVFQMLGHFS